MVDGISDCGRRTDIGEFAYRPAAKAPTMRGTRISRVSARTRTSTNSAPLAYLDLLSLGAANHGELAGIKVGNRAWRKSFRYELGILLDRAGVETAEHVAQRLGGTICREDFAIVDREIIDPATVWNFEAFLWLRPRLDRAR